MQQWQRSRLSVRAFCQRHHLAEPSFYAWRQLLRQRGVFPARPQPPTRSAPSTPPAFIKVTLAAAPNVAEPIEVVLSPQRRLRVHPGFDAATLLALVRLLEESAC
jgi:transposase-like protein